MRNTNSAIYLYDYLNSGLATSLATNLSPPASLGAFFAFGVRRMYCFVFHIVVS